MKLNEIATITMGQSPDSASYNIVCEGIPFFQGNADFGKVHPNVRVWCSSPKKYAHKDDILISVRAPIEICRFAASTNLAKNRPAISNVFIVHKFGQTDLQKFTPKPQEVKPKAQTDRLGFCKGVRTYIYIYSVPI